MVPQFYVSKNIHPVEVLLPKSGRKNFAFASCSTPRKDLDEPCGDLKPTSSISVGQDLHQVEKLLRSTCIPQHRIERSPSAIAEQDSSQVVTSFSAHLESYFTLENVTNSAQRKALLDLQLQ